MKKLGFEKNFEDSKSTYFKVEKILGLNLIFWFEEYLSFANFAFGKNFVVSPIFDFANWNPLILGFAN